MQQFTWVRSDGARFRTTTSLLEWLPLTGVVLFLFVGAWLPLAAQDLQSELKAEFIERFTRLIEWPASADGADPGQPFVIGIVGETHMQAALAGLAARARIKGKAVEIRHYGQASDIGACQVLFVGDSVAAGLAGVLEEVAGKPILTVGDSPGFAKRGVMINFVVDEGFVRFELNRKSTDSAGLALADALVGLAEVVG